MSQKKIKKIKILATLGHSSMKKEIIQKMDSSGVDIFRINLSHTKIEDFLPIINKIQSWTKKPICIDTEGAQLRTGNISNNQIQLKDNDIISLTNSKMLGNTSCLPLYPIEPVKILKIGDILSLDFRSAVIQVVEIDKEKVWARVLSGGEVGSNKGVNIDRVINLPGFTKKDLEILELSKKTGLSYFALSFASQKEDIKKFREFFPYPIFLISKIENRLGLTNLKDVCQESNAILIDRGDLSREIPLQKIALAQKHILDFANKIKMPVYIATNLLETMVNNFQPSRAEINDITSTLMAGAQGLVLAAETAIGKYPVESVRMISEVIKETEKYKISKDKKGYFDFSFSGNLIEPHGGTLVQNFEEIKDNNDIKNLTRIAANEELISDITQIAEGTYSPLKGFMNYNDLNLVLEKYQLANGIVWTLPILFQLKKEDIKWNKNETIVFEREKKPFALMRVSNIERIDLRRVAQKWFATDNKKHPGVANFMRKGDYIISGKVSLLKNPFYRSQSYAFTPRQSREIFRNKAWQTIVGFHTRNVIHQGHEFIQKKALDMVKADGLLISPVVGIKKRGDFTPKAILKSYEIMLRKNYYVPYPALIGVFNTYSRYSGPREVVFTALCRKNFGCSHFVVGRDHTGVGNYYPPEASQELFDKLGDIGIKPLMFNTAYFCSVCGEITDSCQHGDKERLTLSGSDVRKFLINNQDIPDYLMRKEISQELRKMYTISKIFED